MPCDRTPKARQLTIVGVIVDFLSQTIAEDAPLVTQGGAQSGSQDLPEAEAPLLYGFRRPLKAKSYENTKFWLRCPVVLSRA